jgi:hypothetical protein
MGRLIDQFGGACNPSCYHSAYGQSLRAFVLGLIGGSAVGDPLIRLDPYVASAEHVHVSLERMIQGGKMSESFLIVGLIRAIEEVLEDCSRAVVPLQPSGWSSATRRLIAQGILLESAESGLALVGESNTSLFDPEGLVRADLVRWRELTAEILADRNLEEAIQGEDEKT